MKTPVLPIIFLSLAVLVACKEESTLSFSEFTLASKDNTIVELDIILASGDSEAANNVNAEIEKTIIFCLNAEKHNTDNLEVSIQNFNQDYIDFKKDFPESPQVWEAQIDGEVLYQTEDIISISITTYTNTGGAHGLLSITFLNFNPETGLLIPTINLINNTDEFSKLAQFYFEQSITKDDILFSPNTFQLPKNMAYTEEGIVLLYNAYEIAPYSTGIIEFKIPYHDANPFLVLNGS
ncbi:DUF3298 and DUF4163 domain-containing protein [Tamlana fucoidanivorans]|uniref:DUF3298 and DUF4163 domain-containing protein n=1 Tax=Allotamlana fucoidanivorans TaxID=2583814 RepID=A0A5C4SRH1_9FLAO|nr:DUF3298 and DUF4163 domain-containing protein [Tamlana fucoidanivorans]TNJ46993.1 DUF3298 and DUF4163 domain-containing protein [Tamlana fucoidanivorans]